TRSRSVALDCWLRMNRVEPRMNQATVLHAKMKRMANTRRNMLGLSTPPPPRRPAPAPVRPARRSRRPAGYHKLLCIAKHNLHFTRRARPYAPIRNPLHALGLRPAVDAAAGLPHSHKPHGRPLPAPRGALPRAAP